MKSKSSHRTVSSLASGATTIMNTSFTAALAATPFTNQPATACIRSSSCRGIPAPSGDREKRLTPHAQGVSKGTRDVSLGEPDVMEKMHDERFPRSPFYDHEARASTFLRAIAIFRLADVLSFFDGAKKITA